MTNFLRQFNLAHGITSADFTKIWEKYDADKNGYIEYLELDSLAQDMALLATTDVSEEEQDLYKAEILRICDANRDRRLEYKELGDLFVIKEEASKSDNTQKEVFLGHFRSATGIHSTDFIKIWKKYDTDKNNYIEATELDDFLSDLMKQQSDAKSIDPVDLKSFKEEILKFYDTNRDGKLDLKEMFELLPVEENFLAGKVEEHVTYSDFDKIFDHYDQDNDQSISGDELLGFMRDFMVALGRPDLSLSLVEDYTKQMIGLLDKNKDGKFQKEELRELLM